MSEAGTFEAALDDLMAEVWPLPGELSRDLNVIQRLADLRLVYADWLEEQGDRRAGMQRWLVRERKFPRFSGTSWDWWRYGDRPESQHEDLPAAVWDCLPGRPPRDLPYCKEYETREDAERALFKALSLTDWLPR